MSKEWSGFVPMPGKPKPRPKLNTRTGTVYMPKDFEEWREAFGWELAKLKPPRFDGPVYLFLAFKTDGVNVSIFPIRAGTRPKGVRGDADNLAGGVMEVLQDIEVVGNDRDVLALGVRLDESDWDESDWDEIETTLRRTT
jgi:Holliday junction resolvase RusA-like endonuclease